MKGLQIVRLGYFLMVSSKNKQTNLGNQEASDPEEKPSGRV